MGHRSRSVSAGQVRGAGCAGRCGAEPPGSGQRVRVQTRRGMIRVGSLVATGVVTLVASGAEPPGDTGGAGGKADGTLTRVTFDDSWHETAEGPLVAGSPIRGTDDRDRL